MGDIVLSKTSAKSLLLLLAIFIGQVTHSSESNSNTHFDPWFNTLEQYVQGEDVLQELKAIQAQTPTTLLANSNTASQQLHYALTQFISDLQRVLINEEPSLFDLFDLAQKDITAFKSIEPSYRQLRAQHLLYLAALDNVQAKLNDAGASTTKNGLFKEQRENYLSIVEPLTELMDAIFQLVEEEAVLEEDDTFLNQLKQWQNKVGSAFQLYDLQEIIYQISATVFDKNVAILGNDQLPYRASTIATQALPQGQEIQPSYVQSPVAPVTPEDMQPDEQTLFTDTIRLQAQSLNYDPIKIYQFVRNEIDTEWYSGAMKGAHNTLVQRAGNHVDQASLLISLLRVSSVPSRYVDGVVDVPINLIQNQLAVDDPEVAISALRKAGIPVSAQIIGGRIGAARISYTWVSALVPYSNYRGAVVDTTGKLWLPLMPAIKDYQITPGANILSELGLDATSLQQAFFTSQQINDVTEQVTEVITEYLQNNGRDETIEDQLTQQQLIPEVENYLPNSLPVPIVSVLNEAPSLLQNAQHQVRFLAYAGVDQGSETVLDVTLPLSAVVSQRVTLSYLAGTVEEQNLVHQFGGLSSIPAYLVSLRPQIKVDGHLVGAGSQSIPMGNWHRFEVQLITPVGERTVSRNMISGGYHAIGITAQGLVSEPTTEESASDTEYLGARVLSQIALSYNLQWHQSEALLAGLGNRTLIRPFASISFTSNDVVVDSVLGSPQNLNWQGVNLDAKLRITDSVEQTESAYASNQFYKLAGLQGSYLEHKIFQQLFGVESLSADKGLAIAEEQQIPVQIINQANLASLIPLLSLSHSAPVVDAVQIAVEQGLQVTIPETEIVSAAWQGSVWVAEDLSTGEAGYFVARGLAGGTTTSDVADWPSNPGNALQAPYLNEPNDNPFSGYEIEIVGPAFQIGEVATQSEPIRVRVLDIDGRPVVGAPVTFEIGVGSGEFEGGTSIVANTNIAGIAETIFTYPSSTNDNPHFIQLNNTDKFATKIGATYIDVSVSRGNNANELLLTEPFFFYAVPGAPRYLTGVYPLNLGLYNTLGGQFKATVTDENNNPIANAEVTFDPTTMVFRDASVDPVQDIVQENTTRMYTNNNDDNDICFGIPVPVSASQCGSSIATGVTNAFGKIIGYTVLPPDPNPTPDPDETIYGLLDLTFAISTPGVDTVEITTNLTDPFRTRDAYFASQWSLTDPNPTVGVGERYPGKIQIILHNTVTSGGDYVEFVGLELLDNPSEKIGTALPALTAGVNSWVATDFFVSNTQALKPIIARFNHFQQDGTAHPLTPEITTRPSVPVAAIELTVDELQQPVSIVRGDLPGEYQSKNHFFVTFSHPTLYYNDPAVYEYEFAAHVASVRITGQDDDYFINAEHIGQSGGRDIYRANIPKSLQFDIDSTYQVHAVLNRGTHAEVESAPIDLPLDKPVIERVGGIPSLNVEIDTLNNFTCPSANFLTLTLIREAEVVVEMAYFGRDFDPVPVFDQTLSADIEHKIDLPSLTLKPGPYRYRITATAIDDGKVEVRGGDAEVRYTYRSALPIGQPSYEGINLFDGHLAFSNTDFDIKGRGHNINFTRSYSSNNTEPSAMGVGWTHNYDSYVVDSGCGSYTVVGGDGGGVRFMPGVDDNGDFAYRPGRGYHSSLVRVSDGWDFYSKNGSRFHYHRYPFPYEGNRRWYLEYIEDINGNLTKFAYNPGSREAEVIAVEDDSGRKLEFSYEYRGTSSQSISGDYYTSLSKVTFYGDQNNSSSANTIEVNFEYDEFRRLIGIDGPIRQESYEYLIDGTQVTLSDLNDPTSKAYFGDDAFVLRAALSSVERPEGNLEYDWEVRPVYSPGITVVGSLLPDQIEKGFVTSHTNRWGGNNDVEIFYSERGSAGGNLQTIVTDARNVPTEYIMNEFGHPESQIGPTGTRTMTWDTDSALMETSTDENGIETVYTYDDHGNRTGETISDTLNPGEPTFTRNWTYTSKGYNVVLLESQTDRNGNPTIYEYDSVGNLTKITYASAFIGDTAPSNRTTEERFTYDPSNGDRLSATDQRGFTTFYRYDENGNVEQITDPLNNITRRTYNSFSLLQSETDARNNTTEYDHNLLGLPLEVTDPVGTTTYRWNAVGKKLFEADADGRETEWFYSTNNQLERVLRPDKVSDRILTYDLAGNLATETDFRGFTTTYTYNDANFQTDITFPPTQFYDPATDSTSTTSRMIHRDFDNVGNVIREEDANGRVTRYDYDNLYRTTHTHHLINPGLEVTSENIYDGENLIANIDAENRVTRYEYDALNRRTTQIRCLVPGANTISCTNPNQTMRYRFDANGNTVGIVDYRGFSEFREYDALNRLTVVHDRVGNFTTTKYDGVGNVVETFDELLNRTSYVYDDANRQVQKNDPKNNTTFYTYSPAGLLETESWPNGNTIINTYTANGLLDTSADSVGLISDYDYDADDNVIKQTDGEGYVQEFVYNERGEKTQDLLAQRPGASTPRRIITTDYDLFGNVSRTTDPKGFTQVYHYDLINRLVQDTDDNNNSRFITYDNVGNKLTEEDRRGNITTWEYDDLYRVTRIIDPAITGQAGQQQITFDAYDNNGNLLQTTDKRGIVTETTYDGNNRPLVTSRNNVTISTTEYDPVGNVALQTDANGNTISYTYDERNQLVLEARPLAAVYRYDYDAMGNRNYLRDPENRESTWEFDLRNRLESETNPDIETTRYTYTLNNQQQTKQLPKGNNHVWTFAYDDDNRLGTITAPLDNTGQAGVTQYEYDLNNNNTAKIDAENNRTEMTFDNLNRRTEISYPDTASVTYDSYDANSNLTQMTDANGNVVTYQYDEINREISRTFVANNSVASSEPSTVTKAYDENNNVINITESYLNNASPTQITAMTYDDFDRQITRTDSFNNTTRYGYDLNGNRTQLTDPNDQITRYYFDELNRTVNVVNAQGTTTYAYNRASELTTITYPNNTTASYTYYLDGRINTIDNLQNGATVSSYNYTYDPNGNRITQIETNGGAAETTGYVYDNLDRLLSVTYPDNTTTYTYDLAYNRTSETVVDSVSSSETKNRTYNYNNRNQLTDIIDNLDTSQSISYDFDANGNQVQKTQGAEVTQFIYDVRDNLRNVTVGGSSIGQFLYDYQGLRIEKIGERGTERSTYDGLSILLQSDQNNNTLAKYDYGPNRLLSLNHQTEGLQFYLTDALNSVVNLTNNSGAVQARYQYDAWGNKRNEVGDSWNRFGFTGHEHDEETGLIYAKARFYDPDTGRFLGEDAWEGDVINPPSLHKYLYAFMNPTVYWDPDGNKPCADNEYAYNCDPGTGAAELKRIKEEQEKERNKPTEEEIEQVEEIETARVQRIRQQWIEHCRKFDCNSRNFNSPTLNEEPSAAPNNSEFSNGTPGQQRLREAHRKGVVASQVGEQALLLAAPPSNGKELGIYIATGGTAYVVYKVGNKVVKVLKNTEFNSPNPKRDSGNGSYDTEGDFGPLNQTPKVRERGEIQWVDENAAMSDRARNFDDAATGSRSNVITKNGQAPQIMRTLPDGTQRPVRFDGFDGNVLIDRKLSVVTTNKAKDQVRRQSEALRQNGFRGQWEVPSESQAKRAKKMFNELGIDNIAVKVVDEPKL